MSAIKLPDAPHTVAGPTEMAGNMMGRHMGIRGSAAGQDVPVPHQRPPAAADHNVVPPNIPHRDTIVPTATSEINGF